MRKRNKISNDAIDEELKRISRETQKGTSLYNQSDDDDDYQYEESEDEAPHEYSEFVEQLRATQKHNISGRSGDHKAKARARRLFMKQAQSKVNDPEVKLNLAQGHEAFVKGQYELALGHFKAVLNVDAKNSSAFKGLASVAEQMGNNQERLNYLIKAAESDQWGDLWEQIAHLQLEMGHTESAVTSLGKAINLKPSDKASLMYTKAILHKELKQYSKSLEMFRRLKDLDPLNPIYIKELAAVYVLEKRESDAINLYRDLLEKNKKTNGKTLPEFQWTELNILCELYIAKRMWKEALQDIKDASRLIQGRTDETWWDSKKENFDMEFDERRIEFLENNHGKYPPDSLYKEYDLPIDIRFKIGLIRLELGDIEEALNHFNFLFTEEDDISDLFFEAGKALESHGLFAEALRFLPRAVTEDGTADLEVTSHLATCYLATGEYSFAKSAYRAILGVTPDDITVKVSLIEALYYLEENDEARILLDEINDINKTHEYAYRGIDNEEQSLNKRDKEGKALSKEDKLDLQERSKQKVLETFRRLSGLKDDALRGNEIAVDTWLQLAFRLINIFTSVRGFFPRDKNRAFKGFRLYTKLKEVTTAEVINRVNDLIEGPKDETKESKDSRLSLTSINEFRGLSYDNWFMIFVQFALFQGKAKKDYEYAMDIIDTAMDVSVFIQDKSKESILRLVKLAFGVFSNEFFNIVMPYIRFFLASNQFSPFIYRVFLCCFASGITAYDSFSNYNHQKFFLRQLKAFDSIISNKKITGMATITADTSNVKFGDEPCELLYIYANLLGGTRNYISPVVYLNRAYKRYNKDPMICLTLGLAHVHRSMQRLSTNRHIQLLQGISYILEYRDLRLEGSTKYEQQETEYNIARLFHMIGLTSEATIHYNNALKYHEEIEDEMYDLLPDAAYNLSLIYNINGNSDLANEVTEKYLTI